MYYWKAAIGVYQNRRITTGNRRWLPYEIESILSPREHPFNYEGIYAQAYALRGFVFLIVSCPCALVISIPLTFFGGIGAASKRGVLVKGSNYLEALNKVSVVVFDKTGTLTKGVFEVANIIPAAGYQKEQIGRAHV